MSYRLKKGVESFEVVEGPCAGRKYVRGAVYEEIPPQEKRKFEQVKEAEAPKAEVRAKAVSAKTKEG